MHLRGNIGRTLGANPRYFGDLRVTDPPHTVEPQLSLGLSSLTPSDAVSLVPGDQDLFTVSESVCRILHCNPGQSVGRRAGVASRALLVELLVDGQGQGQADHGARERRRNHATTSVGARTIDIPRAIAADRAYGKPVIAFTLSFARRLQYSSNAADQRARRRMATIRCRCSGGSVAMIRSICCSCSTARPRSWRGKLPPRSRVLLPPG